MKKYTALVITIVVLAGGAYVSQRWFAENFRAENIQAASVTFAANAEGTVLDAMNAQKAKGALLFDGREFPGLGFFVEEINGKRSADGYYWILYVNSMQSQTGVSQTFLSAGDVIEWRYEKGY